MPGQPSKIKRATLLLKRVGLRPTRQRLGLVNLLFDSGHRHVGADQLHAEAREAGLSTSLATIYNTLNHFASVGLVRRVVINTGQTVFDTNAQGHHHFYDEATGEVQDIPAEQVAFARLPDLPEGCDLVGVEVIVRVRQRPAAAVERSASLPARARA